MLILGTDKGYVFPYEVKKRPGSHSVTCDPLCDGGLRGKGRVSMIKYLPRSTLIAIQIKESLQLATVTELKTTLDFKKSIQMFCLNQQAYSGDSANESLCLVLKDNTIAFYGMSISKTGLTFEEEVMPNKLMIQN